MCLEVSVNHQRLCQKCHQRGDSHKVSPLRRPCFLTLTSVNGDLGGGIEHMKEGGPSGTLIQTIQVLESQSKPLELCPKQNQLPPQFQGEPCSAPTPVSQRSLKAAPHREHCNNLIQALLGQYHAVSPSCSFWFPVTGSGGSPSFREDTQCV